MTYIFEIKILSNEWDYFIGQIIMIPIKGVNKRHAEERFFDIYSGSQYPNFEVCNIHETDNFLFEPARNKYFRK